RGRKPGPEEGPALEEEGLIVAETVPAVDDSFVEVQELFEGPAAEARPALTLDEIIPEPPQVEATDLDELPPAEAAEEEEEGGKESAEAEAEAEESEEAAEGEEGPGA